MSDVDKATDPKGAEDLGKALADERKAGAGKDKKITELHRELERLQGELEEARGAADNTGEQRSAEIKRLTEIAADIKAREKEMADRQAALNAAVEKGVPISLMMRGAGDLDGYIKELEQFGELVKAGKSRLEKAGAKPFQTAKKSAFELAKLGKNEVARIPARILDRLL